MKSFADPETLNLLRCPQPACGAKLALAGERQPFGKCSGCGALYPVLGGAVVAVPQVPAYMAMYRDSVLASLAEAGQANKDAIATIEAFAAAASNVEPSRFSDDWVRGEIDPDLLPEPLSVCDGEVQGLVAAAREHGLADAMLEMLDGGPRLRHVLELGCGAGALSAELSRRAEHLVVADLSLRAVLRARSRASTRKLTPGAAVLDAEALALAPSKLSAIVAANLVDLLDDPSSFIASCADALAPGGRLLLSTPDPSLDSGDDDELCRCVEAAGLAVEQIEDGVTWLRSHGPRHFQVYVCQVLCAVKPRGKRA